MALPPHLHSHYWLIHRTGIYHSREPTLLPSVSQFLSCLGIIRADFATLHIAYSFLDPNKYGARVAAYVFGVLIGECIIFSIVWGISKLRNKIFINRRTTILGHISSEKGQSGQV